jgi:hypothetical protein
MVNRPRGNQFHFDPATYLGTIRAEVPAYDELQDAVAEATAGIQAERVLELGVGTGETSRRVLDLMDAVCPPPRCSPRSGVAKDIEVYAHYGHEGGVDYQVDWQLSWFVECFPGQG